MAYIPRKNIKQLKPQTKEVIPDSWSSKPAAERGYTSNWTKVRNSYLRKHPLCERCSEAVKMRRLRLIKRMTDKAGVGLGWITVLIKQFPGQIKI